MSDVEAPVRSAVGFAMLDVAGGATRCGSDAETHREQPAHEVVLRDYALADRCVSADDYFEFVRAAWPDLDESVIDFVDPCYIVRRGDGYRLRDGCGGYPMIQISYWGAAAYANWLSERHGLEPVYDVARRTADRATSGYRLPTEAEWEHACRLDGGPTASPDDRDPRPAHDAAPATLAGFARDDLGPIPIDAHRSGPSGFVGMLGNVREWCHDHYQAYEPEPAGPVVDPVGTARGPYRVVRGGSVQDPADLCTASRRLAAHEDTKCEVYGFRLARTTGGVRR